MEENRFVVGDILVLNEKGLRRHYEPGGTGWSGGPNQILTVEIVKPGYVIIDFDNKGKIAYGRCGVYNSCLMYAKKQNAIKSLVLK